MASAEPRILDVFGTLVPLSGVSKEASTALASVAPEVASSFVRFAYRDLKNNPLAHSVLVDICERSLRSEFPLSEWMVQINRVFSWLQEREAGAKLSDVVEYVSCAFEGDSVQPGTTVSWYLDNFGFARSHPLGRAKPTNG